MNFQCVNDYEIHTLFPTCKTNIICSWLETYSRTPRPEHYFTDVPWQPTDNDFHILMKDNITASLTQFRKGQQQHNRQYQKAHTQRATPSWTQPWRNHNSTCTDETMTLSQMFSISLKALSKHYSYLKTYDTLPAAQHLGTRLSDHAVTSNYISIHGQPGQLHQYPERKRISHS